jgi:hypothetical protein
VWLRFIGWFYYLRAQRILSAYRTHYAEALAAFAASGQTQPLVEALSDVGVRIIRSGDRGQLQLPDNYPDLVKRVARDANARLARPENCVFVPGVALYGPSETTDALPAVKNGSVMMIQLRDPLVVDGLDELCHPVINELERKVYRSYVLTDKVYIYRSPVFCGMKSGSWLWHYDNHPAEVLKLMIYLTDVDDETGPFEYCRHQKTLKPLKCAPITPLYGDSRVREDAVREHTASGYETCRVTGPQGTMILFDDNVLHRANMPSRSYRDVVVFQFRPSISERRPCINPGWTGSFQHAPFNRHPDDVRQLTRRLKHFS